MSPDGDKNCHSLRITGLEKGRFCKYSMWTQNHFYTFPLLDLYTIVGPYFDNMHVLKSNALFLFKIFNMLLYVLHVFLFLIFFSSEFPYWVILKNMFFCVSFGMVLLVMISLSFCLYSYFKVNTHYWNYWIMW